MVSSQARYVAIPTIESNAGVGSPSSSSSSRHTSASSSLSSSPRQNSDATLYPYPAGHDQPYELSEKSAWHSRVTSNPTYPPHHLGAVKSNQSLTEGVVHLWRKCKTTILIAICFLLALMLFWQSDHRDPAIGASSSSSNSSSSSSSSLPITTTALPTLHMAQPSKSYRLEDDMVLITKVGSATAHKRLLIHLAEQPLSNLYTPNHIYVSDFALTLGNITFYDALANVSTTIAQLDEFKSLRAELTALMQSNQDLDDMSQKDGGWKLDKYKFLPAIAEAYRRFPAKKWYVMVEADTFLFWNQLVKWLSTLDENKQLMIGHPSFCDYDGQSTMFTHGGSGIVLSKAIVEASFGQDSDFEHTHDELIQKSAFGDALLSKSIYDSPLVTLNELSPEGGEKFNSDPPRVLKFTRDNWCTPIMSFHHITPADAAHLYDFERRIEARLDSKDLVRWADVWDEFIPNFLKDAMDQVGRFDADSQLADHSAEPGEVGVVGWQAIEHWDSETTDLTTLDALECQKWCRAHTNCLLWQWRRVKSQDASDQVESGKCRFTTDFLRIGLTKPNNDDGLTSGWMGTRIDAWRRDHECSGRTGLNSYNLDDLD